MRKEIITLYGKFVAIMSKRFDGDMTDELISREFLRGHGAPDQPRFSMEQVHRGEAMLGTGNSDHVFSGKDGIVSSYGVLEVKTADCFPVVMVDITSKMYAVAHAGWKSVADQILPNTLNIFRKNGSDFSNIIALVFPGINQCCFEVSDDFSQYFSDDKWDFVKGEKHYFDLRGYIESQLNSLGVMVLDDHDLNVCTACSGEYYSYRREETPLRMKTFVWVEEEE